MSVGRALLVIAGIGGTCRSQGRKTREWRSTPVNPLSLAGQRYLVAARGETEWVRNLRVSRTARLTLGRRTETVPDRGGRALGALAPEHDPYLLETSRPGVLAAGDVRAGSVKRVASAVGEGGAASGSESAAEGVRPVRRRPRPTA